MMTQALVDFPFYVPVLLTLFGACLGVIEWHAVNMGARIFVIPGLDGRWPKGLRPDFIRSVSMLALGMLLGLPVFAQWASEYGLARLQTGDRAAGLYWNGLARMMVPGDSTYYWREAVMWREVGLLKRDAALLAKSDAMFAQGYAVNTFDLNLLLDRIALHRQHAHLLPQAASPQTLLLWCRQAQRLQPYSEAVELEYVRCLLFAGQRERALEQVQAMMKSRPGSVIAHRLQAEMTSSRKQD
jgi:hypothetical protein